MPDATNSRQVTPSPVRRILGRYQIEDRLGTDGVIETHRARLQGATGFDRVFIVKSLVPGVLQKRPGSAEGLLAAGRRLATVGPTEPRLVPIVDMGLEPGTAFVVADFVQGVSLRALRGVPRPGTSAADTEDSTLSAHWPSLVALVGAELGRALGTLHGLSPPLIHGDLAPGNVVLTTAGAVRILDCGMSLAVLLPAELSAAGGRRPFLAPEVVRGEAPGPASDVFSLGAVVLEMATGEPPTGTAADADRLAALPRSLRLAVKMMLDPNASHRPTAAKAAELMKSALSGASESALTGALGSVVKRVREQRPRTPTQTPRTPDRPTAEVDIVGDTGGGLVASPMQDEADSGGGFDGRNEATAMMNLGGEGAPSELASLLEKIRTKPAAAMEAPKTNPQITVPDDDGFSAPEQTRPSFMLPPDLAAQAGVPAASPLVASTPLAAPPPGPAPVLPRPPAARGPSPGDLPVVVRPAAPPAPLPRRPTVPHLAGRRGGTPAPAVLAVPEPIGPNVDGPGLDALMDLPVDSALPEPEVFPDAALRGRGRPLTPMFVATGFDRDPLSEASGELPAIMIPPSSMEMLTGGKPLTPPPLSYRAENAPTEALPDMTTIEVSEALPELRPGQSAGPLDIGVWKGDAAAGAYKPTQDFTSESSLEGSVNRTSLESPRAKKKSSGGPVAVVIVAVLGAAVAGWYFLGRDTAPMAGAAPALTLLAPTPAPVAAVPAAAIPELPKAAEIVKPEGLPVAPVPEEGGLKAEQEIAIGTEPAGAMIWFGGKERGATPAKVKVPAGTKDVRLVRAGHKVALVRLSSVTPAVMDEKLEPTVAAPWGKGVLMVECSSKNKQPVLIDGAESGLLCPSGRIGIAPGKHEVAVMDPATGEIEKQEIDVGTRTEHVRFGK